MSILERARRTYARLKAQRNGHAAPSPQPPGDYAVNAINVVSPLSGPASYQLVTRADDLTTVAGAVEDSALVGLDVETTGLDPRTDRVRLLQLAVDRGDDLSQVYVLDLFALAGADLAPLWDALAEVEIVGHNLAFDLRFLRRLGFVPRGRLHDLLILARLLAAGARNSGNKLADLAERYLGVTLDKTEQKGDWTVPTLNTAQIEYAVRDVVHLEPLRNALNREIDAVGLTQTAALEMRTLPAWVWMVDAGMPLDVEAWEQLATRSAVEQERLWDALVEIAPKRGGDLPGCSSWDFDSARSDIVEILGLLGFKDLKSTKDDELAKLDHPFANKLRDYRRAQHLDSNYGSKFLRHVHEGRIFADWNQTGNEAGRSSCSHPNLQGIPRRKEYRQAFRAPEGHVLVKCDFAAVHLRIVAKVASEEKMLAAFQAKRDLHRMTAAALLRKPEPEVTKQDRQLAKAVAFGLLYGMGAAGLRDYALKSYGVAMTLDEAAQHKRTFFQTYPGLAKWHRDTEAGRATQTESRTLGGRRRLLDPKTPLMHRLNSPVLGTEGDAAKTALALLWERRDLCPDARPVAFIHDEIVLEAPADQAESAAAWVASAMTDGLRPLIDPVPVEVEVSIGQTWGGA
jgi:DNA polymerase-1